LQCGLPTENCRKDHVLFGDKIYVEQQKVKKSTAFLIIIQSLAFLSIGILFVDFSFEFIVGFVLVMYSIYETTKHLIHRKISSDYVNNTLFENIVLSIGIILFTLFFMIIGIYGGTPASDQYAQEHYIDYEPGHFYLNHRRYFREVSEETYRFIGLLEHMVQVFAIVILITIIIILIDKKVRKRKANI